MEFVTAKSKEWIFASIILLIIVSLSSVPILNISFSSLFIFISVYKNLPINDCFDTRISFKPSLNNFFALR